jgi:hypothetical protein
LLDDHERLVASVPRLAFDRPPSPLDVRDAFGHAEPSRAYLDRDRAFPRRAPEDQGKDVPIL